MFTYDMHMHIDFFILLFAFTFLPSLWFWFFFFFPTPVSSTFVPLFNLIYVLNSSNSSIFLVLLLDLFCYVFFGTLLKERSTVQKLGKKEQLPDEVCSHLIYMYTHFGCQKSCLNFEGSFFVAIRKKNKASFYGDK